ncbi:MAG: CoA-transferase [Gemmataceae bacterium]
MDPLPQGQGRLLSDVSSDRARAFFATKPRGHEDKLTTVADAVGRLVHDGDYLAIGGFGADRIPTAVLHEVLRRVPQRLRFSGHTATHDFQILCAGNGLGNGRLLAAVDIAYIVGLEARGLSPHARRVCESGEVEFTEWSNYTLALRLKAAAMGVPFLPARSLLGTDTFAHKRGEGDHLPVHRRDTGGDPGPVPRRGGDPRARGGSVRQLPHPGTSVADWELAQAAKRLIITCERLILEDEIRRDPTRTAIPFYCVDAVCEVPYGSYPGNMPYEYFSDEEHLKAWMAAEADVETYRAWLAKYIYGVKEFGEYLDLCGGLKRMQQLRRQEWLLDQGG